MHPMTPDQGFFRLHFLGDNLKPTSSTGEGVVRALQAKAKTPRTRNSLWGSSTQNGAPQALQIPSLRGTTTNVHVLLRECVKKFGVEERSDHTPNNTQNPTTWAWRLLRPRFSPIIAMDRLIRCLPNPTHTSNFLQKSTQPKNPWARKAWSLPEIENYTGPVTRNPVLISINRASAAPPAAREEQSMFWSMADWIFRIWAWAFTF